MKGKIKPGKDMKKAVDYIDKPTSSFILASTGKEKKDFLERCKMLRKMRPDVEVPVIHISISCPPGETLTNEQWREAATTVLEEMGLEEHDFIARRHSDTENDHVHIIASKIHPRGKLWNDSHSARRLMKACTAIEKKLNLTKTKTLEEFRQETGQKRQRMRDGDLRIVARTGDVGTRRKAAIAAKIKMERLANEKANAGKNGGQGQGRIGQQGRPAQITKDGKTAPLAHPKVGEVRSKQIGEAVHFYQNKTLVALMTPDRIELFGIDEKAIEFAIQQAVKSGKVPLQIFGKDEFIKTAQAVAERLRVPVQNDQHTEMMERVEREQQARTEAAQQQAAAERAMEMQQLSEDRERQLVEQPRSNRGWEYER